MGYGCGTDSISLSIARIQRTCSTCPQVCWTCVPCATNRSWLMGCSKAIYDRVKLKGRLLECFLLANMRGVQGYSSSAAMPPRQFPSTLGLPVKRCKSSFVTPWSSNRKTVGVSLRVDVFTHAHIDTHSTSLMLFLHPQWQRPVSNFKGHLAS